MKADPARLRTDLEWLAVPRDPEQAREGLARVRDRLRDEFRAMGYPVEDLPIDGIGAPYPNLLARQGEGHGPVWVVGAHYDAVPGTPGADDNASAVAALLHVMRCFAALKPKSPIVFAAYTLEEHGYLGSQRHVEALRESKTQVAGMVSLEMVGFTSSSQEYPPGLSWFYPKEGKFIAVVADWKSRRILSPWVAGMKQVQGLDVQTLSVPAKGWLVPAVRLSDHSPFWDARMPALMVTDTSFYRNPHYHRSTDTIATLDLAFLALVAEGVARALATVVGA